MKLIIETIEDIKTTIEESQNNNKEFYIEGIFIQTNIKNRNGRIYPKDMMVEKVNQYVENYVKTKRAYGELGHPSNPEINLDRVSHLIVDLKESGDNFIGKAKILDTPMGNIAKGIIEGGGKLAVSTRGLGTLKEENGVAIVQSDYIIKTAADIVAEPSAPEAFVNGIMEGVEWFYDDDGKLRKEEIAEKAKKEINEAVAKRELNTEKMFEIFESYVNEVLNRIKIN